MSRQIGILIPSYDRPDLLKDAIEKWLALYPEIKILIVAQASTNEKLLKYKIILSKYDALSQIAYQLIPHPLGSVKARNVLLELARKHNCDYAVMVDDDCIPTVNTALEIMAKHIDTNNAGLVGGRVIVTKKRKDPDFFLNLPVALADSLSRLIGYVFLDMIHGPRFCNFMPHFFMIKKEILEQSLRYDLIFETPTGFREESDFQLQVKSKGYPLIFDPRVEIIHLAAEVGGDRPGMGEGKRMYWKSHNHTLFIYKWNSSTLAKLWYLFCLMLILSTYRVWHISLIFKGMKQGIKDSSIIGA